jgi:hypothetical protein
MRMLCKSDVRRLVVLVLVFWPIASFANEPPSPPAQPPAKKSEPSGLRGNTLPQCLEGQYVASMVCKWAPPGFYLEHGMKYPAPCPPGTTSPAASKAKAHCVAE